MGLMTTPVGWPWGTRNVYRDFRVVVLGQQSTTTSFCFFTSYPILKFQESEMWQMSSSSL
ncbi:conserved hypothetical protein [Ricinus communis]|uniref:Uncharacterized protein n=1 Tax=Ricinus communis TaxID=3988 RepID=B9SVX2_RICCO|nr:conserved hypothetical protein [Ricinus communis]